LLAGIDLFVLPSLREAFPNALLEAMASRTACVATDVGSVRELVRDGDNACLVKPGSATALAALLDLLLGDRDRRERLAEAARQTMENEFAIDDKAREFIDYLVAVAARRRRRVQPAR
jgi:glycosyltransferase involved in cell wall biosynthesis